MLYNIKYTRIENVKCFLPLLGKMFFILKEKLVGVIRGQVFDVAVDLHEDSMTYCRWGIELSKENDMQF